MANYIALKIFNQKELDYTRKLYNYNTHIHFEEPIFIYLDEEKNYAGNNPLQAIKDPNEKYMFNNFIITDVKYLMRNEKLKRING